MILVCQPSEDAAQDDGVLAALEWRLLCVSGSATSRLSDSVGTTPP